MQPEARSTGEPAVTPSATAAVTAAPSAPAVTSTPTQQPPGAGVWLVEVESGAVHTLFEAEHAPYTLGFAADGESVWLYLGTPHESVRLSAAGELDRVEGFPADVSNAGRCRPLDEDGPAAEIDGRRYAVNCGVFSPDGGRMTYSVQPGPTVDVGSGYRVPLYDQWVLDLASGERTLLQSELRHCGGCDSRAAPSWSPSGRYVLYPELYSGEGGSRVFLSDVETGETRVVADGRTGGGGVNEAHRAPVWSPSADVLLRPAADGGAVLERLPSGETVALPELPWPARFGESGRYVYSPAYSSADILGADRETTIVADAASGEVVAEWPGSPALRLFERGIIAAESGPAALIERADGCDGTLVRHPRAAGGAFCIDGARGATWQPGGERVAFARLMEGTETRWRIVIVDVASGEEQVVASDALGWPPPLLWWNQSGTYLLVVWPGARGV